MGSVQVWEPLAWRKQKARISSARIMMEVRRRLWQEACSENTGFYQIEKLMDQIKALDKRIAKRLFLNEVKPIPMSADKRSVATDALQTLGTIIDETAGRDAIHLAVEPVIAGEHLKPGQDIGIRDGRAYGSDVKLLGIVDPFLPSFVQPGQMFWLIVYPRTITSLRHVWSHPEFEQIDTEKRAIAERVALRITSGSSQEWLKNYADAKGISYDEMMRVAKSHSEGHWDYITLGEDDTDLPDEFWDHYQKVTGEKVPEINRGSFFSCSC